MQNNDIAIILLITFNLIIVGVVAFQSHEMIGEVRALRKILKHDLEAHQDWLFHQLYSMSPGKVLKPDEIIEEEADAPAEVYNPNNDPMNEFKGKKNDWF